MFFLSGGCIAWIVLLFFESTIKEQKPSSLTSLWLSLSPAVSWVGWIGGSTGQGSIAARRNTGRDRYTASGSASAAERTAAFRDNNLLYP